MEANGVMVSLLVVQFRDLRMFVCVVIEKEFFPGIPDFEKIVSASAATIALFLQ